MVVGRWPVLFPFVTLVLLSISYFVRNQRFRIQLASVFALLFYIAAKLVHAVMTETHSPTRINPFSCGFVNKVSRARWSPSTSSKGKFSWKPQRLLLVRHGLGHPKLKSPLMLASHPHNQMGNATKPATFIAYDPNCMKVQTTMPT